MSDKIYISAVTGQTITCQLYLDGAASGTPLSASEIGSTGVYTATVPADGDPNGFAYGYYFIRAIANSATVASGELYWSGTEEISPIMYERLHRARGLQVGAPATNTLTNLTAGDINVDITGDLETTTTYTATS